MDLLEKSRRILEKLIDTSSVKKAAEGLLWHPDLNMRNIYVSDDNPTEITGIIDWQAAGIDPAFMNVLETPDFADKLPFDPDLDQQGESEGKVEARKDAERCNQAFSLHSKMVPKLRYAKALDDRMTRIFNLCNSGWRMGAAMLRSELLIIKEAWPEDDLGPCPVDFNLGKEELASQERNYEDFEAVQRLKSMLARVFYGSSDGWVPADEWSTARKRHKELFEDWLVTAVEADKDMTEEKARGMWPWDER